MPIQNLDAQYNFSRSYDSLPPVNLPLRVTRLYDKENVDATSYTSLTAFTNKLDKVMVYPDFGTPPAGIPAATDFVDNFRYFIDFGDGTVKSDLSAEHYYKAPGDYTITIVAADSGTNFFVGTQRPVVRAIDAIPDKIILTHVNETSGFAINSSSVMSPIHLTRWNSYQTWPSLSSTGYSINLTCSGNRSPLFSKDSYYRDINAHLKSFSAFVKRDESSNSYEVVSNVITDNTLVYGERNSLWPGSGLPYNLFGFPKDGTVFLGTSGDLEFFYYED